MFSEWKSAVSKLSPVFLRYSAAAHFSPLSGQFCGSNGGQWPITMTVFALAPEGFECFAFIFVPYSHYDEPKTLSYFMKPVWLLNAYGEKYIYEFIYL